MNGKDVPDAWDEPQSNAQSNLNVGAKPFVPNVNAPAFVPSFRIQPRPSPTAPPPNSFGDASNQIVEEMEVSETIETKVSQLTVQDNMDDSQSPSMEVSNQKAANEKPPVIEELTKASIPKSSSSKSLSNESRSTPPPQASEDQSTHSKEHLNVVFIGHVDAGKSTIGGQIMFLTGMVDKRTLEKYEREAKEKNRETWYLSWALDTNMEEREKGKTVEVGRAYFETDTKHFAILDAPGHRSFVPNMIGGASQADVAVLVISARRGEFETGFERGGQTREHAMLAKTAGVQHLVVLVNKMDDPTVKWSETRYNECKEKLTPFLKKVGFNPKKDIHFMPCSGLTGANLKHSSLSDHPWYKDLPLIPYLDNLPTMVRSSDGPVRLPIVDKYKDMGVIVLGKIESGQISKGQQLVMQPNKRKVKGIKAFLFCLCYIFITSDVV